jgi:hypothetical protein
MLAIMQLPDRETDIDEVRAMLQSFALRVGGWSATRSGGVPVAVTHEVSVQLRVNGAPRAATVATALPRIESYSVVTRSTLNPFGVKGVGEPGTTGVIAAVVNAVMDALARYGIRHLDMPVPQRKSGPPSSRASFWRRDAPAGNKADRQEQPGCSQRSIICYEPAPDWDCPPVKTAT